jgi:hypothetical protein
VDSYLNIAEDVLGRLDGPLTAKQILNYARELKIIPSHLHGKTQHKTLQARISEDILHRRWRSPFMRTEPGHFVLRTRIKDSVAQHGRFDEFPAPRRSDQLRQFNVLCANINWESLDTNFHLLGQSPSMDFLRQHNVEYKKLADVWHRADYSFARLFVMMVRDNKVAVFGSNRAKKSGDSVNPEKAIGLAGYVKDEDANLFSSDVFGLTEAIHRTVLEQFHMVLPQNKLLEMARVSIKGILRTPEPLKENSFLVVASFECPIEFDVIRQIGNSYGSEWSAAADRRNDLSDFESISRMVISSGMLNSVGKNEETDSRVNSAGRRANYSTANQ